MLKGKLLNKTQIYRQIVCDSLGQYLLKQMLMPYSTVTGSADFGFILLLRRPQGPQGCLEKQNYPLSWNLAVWCAKIGPKTQKLQKTSEMTRKTTKNDGFLMVL